MGMKAWNVQWLNHNSQRKYPLAEDATGLDTTGGFSIPDNFLVGLKLSVHHSSEFAPDRFLIRRVVSYSTGYSVVIAYQPTVGDPVEVASFSVPTSGMGDGDAVFPVGGLGDLADWMGHATIGTLDAIDEQPGGAWTFNLAGGRLDADAIQPILRSVSSLTIVNSGQVSDPITGPVRLVAGTNCQLVPSEAGGITTITINFLQGEGTIQDCGCEEGVDVGLPIRTINGISPNDARNFFVSGTTCLQVTSVTNGIRLDDTCSSPCCGPAELERITEDLQFLSAQAAAIKAMADDLGVSVRTMDLIVLGAKLGDQPCIGGS